MSARSSIGAGCAPVRDMVHVPFVRSASVRILPVVGCTLNKTRQGLKKKEDREFTYLYIQTVLKITARYAGASFELLPPNMYF